MTDDKTAENTTAGKTSATSGASVASDIKAAVSDKYDQTMTEARTRAEDAKEDVATEVKDVAEALRHAADELREGSAQERTLGQIAGGIADAADAIRDKDLGEIVEMTSNLGRRNPALFLGGAAFLGFVASRYVKASAHGANDATHTAKDHKRQVETFVSEGNPNTQPVEATP
jgi:gas vesicle protein